MRNMEDELYREQILEHYRNPQNRRVPKRYDAKGSGVNPLCGDSVTVYVAVKRGTLENVSFEGEGCAISMASASMLTERSKGMNREDVQRMTAKDMYALLGVDINPAREKCALLPLQALQQGLSDL